MGNGSVSSAGQAKSTPSVSDQPVGNLIKQDGNSTPQISAEESQGRLNSTPNAKKTQAALMAKAVVHLKKAPSKQSDEIAADSLGLATSAKPKEGAVPPDLRGGDIESVRDKSPAGMSDLKKEQLDPEPGMETPMPSAPTVVTQQADGAPPEPPIQDREHLSDRPVDRAADSHTSPEHAQPRETNARSVPPRQPAHDGGGFDGRPPDNHAHPGPNHSGHDDYNVQAMMANHQRIMQEQIAANAISAQIQGASAMAAAVINAQLDGVKEVSEIAKKGGAIATSAIG